LLSITQLNRKLACEVHGSLAVFIGTLGGFVQQSKDAISSIIRRYSVAYRHTVISAAAPLRGKLLSKTARL
jgi:hypothetical protein